MSVTIPVGTTATDHVPALGHAGTTVQVSYGSVLNRAVSGTLKDGYLTIANLPSRRYTFTRSPKAATRESIPTATAGR